MLLLLQQPAPLPFLSPAFGSHMVLQRDRPNTFWGWTAPGAKVTVTVGDKKATGVAAADGKWTVKLNPPKTGGPYTVSVDGSQHIVLTDVLVGDVWLCTGQSNMEFGLTMEKGGAAEVAAANDPNLRILLVPHQVSLTPQKVNGGIWKVATPETVAQEGWGGFSAVGYHFGKALRREVGVPIGLVGDYWGGTNAESWASREALKPLGDFDAALQKIDHDIVSPSEVDGGIAGVWQSADLNTAGWKTVGALSLFHDLDLDNYDGTVWARKEFTLTDAQVGAAKLSLGAIDDEDITWINGTQVGATAGYNTPRHYDVPAGVLHAGRNVIAVKVIDTGAFGGFSGPADLLSLTLSDGSNQSLAGEWLGHRGASMGTVGPNVQTALSNGMIEPIVPLGIKGAIWYQGENNAGRAYQYRRILPAMIGDWRRRFNQGDFPFFIVSLAGYQAHKTVPSEDDWAELREAQMLTAQNVKNAGIAMAIDVGDAADIHPTDKKTVGERLALVALAKTYGKIVAYSGPTYKSLTVKGNEATVKFEHADGGLIARGGPLGEFSIAGEDKKWYWANARIDGDTIVLSSPDVPKPVAVRYAWQSNPAATLYNGSGLPAVPFRTDSWPGVTVGKK